MGSSDLEFLYCQTVQLDELCLTIHPQLFSHSPPHPLVPNLFAQRWGLVGDVRGLCAHHHIAASWARSVAAVGTHTSDWS